MKIQPILSIVTVCYNNFSGLICTYNSIKIQNFEKNEIEWIVIDGGSTDGTVDFINNCNIINYKISENDKGIYDAMNKGTNIANGKYIMYLNSGDELIEGRSILKDIYNKNIDLFFFNAIYFYGKYKKTRYARKFASVEYSIPANHQAILFRKDALDISPYDIKYNICGDYYLLAYLYKKRKSYEIIENSIVLFSIGGLSTFNIFSLISEANNIQKNILNISFLKRYFFVLKRFLSLIITILIFMINNKFNNENKNFA